MSPVCRPCPVGPTRIVGSIPRVVLMVPATVPACEPSDTALPRIARANGSTTSAAAAAAISLRSSGSNARIVRLGLLPAIMKMAGDRTWWLPTWLDERLPYLDTEGATFARDAGHLRRTAGL